MDVDFARRFADDWIAAWNGRDLDAVLAHYDEDIEFTSPFIAKITGEPSGTVHGKPALRSFLERALAAAPSLHFELLLAFHGMDSIVIHYRGHRPDGRVLAAEVLIFNAENKVVRGFANYGV